MPVSQGYQHIATGLSEQGLDLKTAAWTSMTASEQLRITTRKIQHTTPEDAVIRLDSDLDAINSYLTETPDRGSDVVVLVIERDTNVVVGYYQFGLGHNLSKEDHQRNNNEMGFSPEQDQALLGLKWIQGPYRGFRKVFGAGAHRYNVNMAMTEVGWCIMEYQGHHTKALSLYATAAGEKSGQNAGMVDGELTLSSRKKWTQQTEEFAEKAAAKGIA